MKKVLIAKSDLPLSMAAANEATLRQCAPAPMPCPPAAFPQYAPVQAITNEMLDVLFNNDEVMVLKSVLSGDIYTIDHGIKVAEPNDKDLTIYHHLGDLIQNGISLNQYHYDTLATLFDVGTLTLPLQQKMPRYTYVSSPIAEDVYQVIDTAFDDAVQSTHTSKKLAELKCADLNAKDKG